MILGVNFVSKNFVSVCTKYNKYPIHMLVDFFSLVWSFGDDFSSSIIVKGMAAKQAHKALKM